MMLWVLGAVLSLAVAHEQGCQVGHGVAAQGGALLQVMSDLSAQGGALLHVTHGAGIVTSGAALETELEELIVDLTGTQAAAALEPSGLFSAWSKRYQTWEWNRDHVVWLSLWLTGPVFLVAFLAFLTKRYGVPLVRKAVPVGAAVAFCTFLGILAHDLGGPLDHFSPVSALITVVFVMEMGTIERFAVKVTLRTLGTVVGAVMAVIAVELAETASHHHVVNVLVSFAVFTSNVIMAKLYSAYAYLFTMASVSYALLFFGYLKKGWTSVLNRFLSVLFAEIVSLASVLFFDWVYQDYDSTIGLVLVIEKCEKVVGRSFVMLDFAFLRVDVAVRAKKEFPEIAAAIQPGEVPALRPLTDVMSEVKSFPAFDLEKNCQACGGTGKVVPSVETTPSLENNCAKCHGQGKVQRLVKVGDHVIVRSRDADLQSNGCHGCVTDCKDEAADVWVVDLAEEGDKELRGCDLVGGVAHRIHCGSPHFEFTFDSEVATLEQECRSAISDTNFIRQRLPTSFCDYWLGATPDAHFSELMHPVYSQAAALARLPEADIARWLAGSPALEIVRRELISTKKAFHQVFDFLKVFYRAGGDRKDNPLEKGKLTEVLGAFQTIVAKLQKAEAKLVEVEVEEVCASTSASVPVASIAEESRNWAEHSTNSYKLPHNMQERLDRWRFTAMCQGVDLVAGAYATLALDLLMLARLDQTFDVTISNDFKELGLTVEPITLKITGVAGLTLHWNLLTGDDQVRPGDRLYMVNGVPIKSVERFNRKVKSAQVVTVTLRRVMSGKLECELALLARMDASTHSARMDNSRLSAKKQSPSGGTLLEAEGGDEG